MDPFLGEIKMVGFNFAPVGWALCDGQLLSIAQNTALFSLLGTTYGGDGVRTFALPDLRGRVPVHQGQGPGLSPYNTGQAAGSETVTLTTNQMPTHTHQANASSSGATQPTPQGNVWAASRTDLYNATPNAAMSTQAIGTAGGSQPHPNIQPYLCVNFIIALQGVYPSRS